jgi:O-antigen biosynthesis protein WbqP
VLEIPVKANLEGEYVEKESFLFDCKYFFGMIGKFLKSDGVVEGGISKMKKHEENQK